MVDAALEKRNPEFEVSVLASYGTPRVAVVELACQKRRPRSRTLARPPRLYANYCPFCGVEYAQEKPTDGP
jgi:hypothetical protein